VGEGFVLGDGEGEYGGTERDVTGRDIEAEFEAAEVDCGTGEGAVGGEGEMETDVAIATE